MPRRAGDSRSSRSRPSIPAVRSSSASRTPTLAGSRRNLPRSAGGTGSKARRQLQTLRLQNGSPGASPSSRSTRRAVPPRLARGASLPLPFSVDAAGLCCVSELGLGALNAVADAGVMERVRHFIAATSSQTWWMPPVERIHRALGGLQRDASGKASGCNLEFPEASMLRASRQIATEGQQAVDYWPMVGRSCLPSWLVEDDSLPAGRPGIAVASAPRGGVASPPSSNRRGEGRRRRSNDVLAVPVDGAGQVLQGSRRVVMASGCRAMDTVLLPRLVTSGPAGGIISS